MIPNLEKISEIIESKVGEGKEFKTAKDALQCCHNYVNALGPVVKLGGGLWGVKFIYLIPELEILAEKENNNE